MNVILYIPDHLAERLAPDGADLAQQALEGLALEAFRADRLTHTELRQLLGLETDARLDAFLKAHGAQGAALAQDRGMAPRADAIGSAPRRSPTEAAARMRRARQDNPRLDDATLRELMTHGRA